MRLQHNIFMVIVIILLTKSLGFAALTGDINSDGTVNSLDWGIMNSQWFTSGPEADLNGDGLVNSLDFGLMNANWGKVEVGETQNFFISFPLRGVNAYNAIINSIFDHHINGQYREQISNSLEYDKDGIVVAYTNERGDTNNSDDCYQNQDGSRFLGNLNYRGALADDTYLCYDGHPGWDYKPNGTHVDVLAVGAGKVIEAGWFDPNDHSVGVGQYVKIDHENGYYTIYGHLNSIDVAVNVRVINQQKIGTTGNTGRSTGEHLHFQVRYGNNSASRVSVDPYDNPIVMWAE